MSTTPVYTVYSPAANTHYYGPSGTYWCVPSAGTAIQGTTQAFDGSGNLIVVSGLTSVINDYTTQLNKDSYTGTYNTVHSSFSSPNGSDTYRAGGWTSQSGVGSLKMWLSYTGRAYDLPPNTPTNLSPSGLITTLTPTFGASFSDPTSGDYFAQYEIQVANAANGGGSVIWDSGNVATNTWEQQNAALSAAYGGPALSFGSQYSWRVRMANQNGLWSGFTAWTNFNTASGPNSPSNLKPNGLQNSLTPGWSFTYSSPSGYNMAYYRYQLINAGGSVIYDTGNVAQTAANGATVSGTIPSGYLAYGQSYTISAAVLDSNGANSSWTSSQFNVASLPQATPSSPTGNATVSTQTPTLGWTFADQNYAQQSFQVQVYNRSTGALIQDSGQIVSNATSWTMTTSVAYGTNIQWRVQVWDAAGLGSGWSSYALAQVNNAPTATITAPSNNQIITTATPTIAWNYGASAGGYAQASATIYIQDSNGNQLASYTLNGTGTMYTLPAGLILNNTTYKVVVSVTDTNNDVGTSAAITFTLQYTAPADMQGQSLGDALNLLVSPKLNTDGGSGIPVNWSIGNDGPGSYTATNSIDTNIIHPEQLADGDGPETGAWHLQFQGLIGGTGTLNGVYIAQTLNIAGSGLVPGVSRISAMGWYQLAQETGTPTASMALYFLDASNTQLGVTSGAAAGDTAGSTVHYQGPQNVLIPNGTAHIKVECRLNLSHPTTANADAADLWWLDVQVETNTNVAQDPMLSTDGGAGVASGWTSATTANVTAAYSHDSTTANPLTSSPGSQKIIVSADTAAAGAVLAEVTQDLALSSVNLSAGQTISAGAYTIVAKNAGAPVARVAVTFLDANNNPVSTTYGTGTQGDTASAWAYLAGPQNLSIPVAAVTLRLRLQFLSAASGDTGSVWWSGAFVGLATSASDSNFICGDLGTGFSFDSLGRSVRTNLTGNMPSIVANVGAAGDPATAQGGSITITWDTSLADARFAYYLIERRRYDQANDTAAGEAAWITLAEISVSGQQSYTDLAAGGNTVYQYSIRQVVSYADGSTGVSQHRAIVAGSVNYAPAWYLVSASGTIYNLRLNVVDTKRRIVWKERAQYTDFLGRVGQARDAGPAMGYALSLVCYFDDSWGDSRPATRRLLVAMQRLNVMWYIKDPEGLVVPVYLSDINFDEEDTYSDTLMTVTFSLMQAQDTTDY